MRKLILFLVVVSLLVMVGCAPTHISKVQDKHGPPGDTVQKGDFTVHFYYTYYGEGFRSYGWWCRELTCNKDGYVTKKREYWVGNNQDFKAFRELLKQGIVSQ